MINSKQLRIYIFRLKGHSVVALLGLAYSSEVFAYLDPGTGSIILQGLIAGFMGAVAAGGVFWHRIKAFLSSLFSSNKSKINDSDHEPD